MFYIESMRNTMFYFEIIIGHLQPTTMVNNSQREFKNGSEGGFALLSGFT